MIDEYIAPLSTVLSSLHLCTIQFASPLVLVAAFYPLHSEDPKQKESRNWGLFPHIKAGAGSLSAYMTSGFVI